MSKVYSMMYSVVDTSTNKEVDSNVGSEPLEFITGIGQIIPGLENEVLKMNTGDKADILVKAQDAYGDRNPEAIQTLPKEQFSGIELEEGMMLYGNGENGETVQVMVQSFDDDSVTIDYNHPLAGKDLMFSVEIVDVRDATEEELATGVVGGVADSYSCGTCY
jgi:FKBP-type peptidyl-prolyl cis-trans isomerase SlyD